MKALTKTDFHLMDRRVFTTVKYVMCMTLTTTSS